jgi:hypothetical protein
MSCLKRDGNGFDGSEHAHIQKQFSMTNLKISVF